MSACSSCGARIDWALTAKGSRIPLDPATDPPADGANLELDDLGVVHNVGKGNGTRLSHFVTCPSAERHRRRPRGSPGRGGRGGR